MRVRDGSNHLNSTRTTDVCGTNLKCFSDFCLFFIIIILMTKVLTKKKSNSTKEFAITYFFNKFIMSLITSFYKETYELSVIIINTKKFLCSGVPQSPR